MESSINPHSASKELEITHTIQSTLLYIISHVACCTAITSTCLGDATGDLIAASLPGTTVVQAFGDQTTPGKVASEYTDGSVTRVIPLKAGCGKVLILCSVLDLAQCAELILVNDQFSPERRIEQVTIIAEDIRISRHTVLDFRGLKGVRVCIIARKLSTTSEAALEINCFGESSPLQSPSNFGNFILAADSCERDGKSISIDTLTLTTREWRKTTYETKSINGAASSIRVDFIPNQLIRPSTRNSPPFVADGIRVTKGSSTNYDVKMFADTMSEPELTDSLCYGAWRLRALEAIEFDLQETLLLDDTLQAIKCIRRLRAMPRWPTAAEFKPQASQELTRIEKLSKGIRRIPMVEQIKVSQDASMPVQLLLDGPKLELRAMPTDLLIRYRRLADGRDVIGTIDFDSKLPDVVTLSMDLEVVLNGRVAAALEQQLTKTGESFEGIFLDWQPKPRLTNIPGIVSINSSLAGNVLHLDLGLDTRRAHILLWRLSSDEGVPFEFDWVDASDAAAQRVRPPLHLLLRLTRRSVQPIPIQVQDFVVRNIGPHDVYLDYFTQKTDQVVNRKQRVWRALAIPKNGVSVFLKAGQSVSCSNFKIMDLSTLQVLNAEPVIGDVPPDSLRFEVGTDPLEEFSRVAGLLEKLILRNRVPAFDATRQVQLRAVEISVTPLQEGAIMNELRVGPISLAPADSVGSEFQVPFFGGGRITGFHIEGTAYYVGGGKDDFKTDVGKIGSFDVTSEILNPIPLN